MGSGSRDPGRTICHPSRPSERTVAATPHGQGYGWGRGSNRYTAAAPANRAKVISPLATKRYCSELVRSPSSMFDLVEREAHQAKELLGTRLIGSHVGR